MAQITFIIPNRGGEHIDYVIKRLREFYPDEEYIVINQDDDKPFMRCQILNIGYRYATGQYLCFIDNDMFWGENVDLIGEYERLGCSVLQPFTRISQVKINDDGSYTVTSTSRKHVNSAGGIWLISKANFEKFNGVSNLYLGYGYEDNDTKKRCGIFKDIDKTVCHITHPTRSPWGGRGVDNFHTRLNDNVFRNYDKRNIMEDGYRDTIYNLKSDETKDGVRYITVDNIYVKEDFPYKNLIDKHYER